MGLGAGLGGEGILEPGLGDERVLGMGDGGECGGDLEVFLKEGFK